MRMILFAIVFAYLFLYVIFLKKDKFSLKSFLCLFIFLFVIIAYTTIIGFLNNPLSFVWHDLKKYLFILIFPLILSSKLLDRKNNKKIIKAIILICSLIISMFSILVYVSTNILGIDLYTFFHSIMPKFEIIRRQNGGGIYLPSQITVFLVLVYQIYRIFISNERKGFIYFTAVINFLCILQTSTRSYLFFLYPYLLCCALFCLTTSLRNDKISNFLIPFMLFFTAFTIANHFIDSSRLVSSNEPGSGKRESYIFETLKNITFFGKGFGSQLKAIGYADLEIPVLEILYEAGILGSFCWFSFFAYYLFKLFKSKKNKAYFYVATALFISSLANPYLLTPMGWFSLIVCYVFSISSD